MSCSDDGNEEARAAPWRHGCLIAASEAVRQIYAGVLGRAEEILDEYHWFALFAPVRVSNQLANWTTTPIAELCSSEDPRAAAAAERQLVRVEPSGGELARFGPGSREEFVGALDRCVEIATRCNRPDLAVRALHLGDAASAEPGLAPFPSSTAVRECTPETLDAVLAQGIRPEEPGQVLAALLFDYSDNIAADEKLEVLGRRRVPVTSARSFKSRFPLVCPFAAALECLRYDYAAARERRTPVIRMLDTALENQEEESGQPAASEPAGNTSTLTTPALRRARETVGRLLEWVRAARGDNPRAQPRYGTLARFLGEMDAALAAEYARRADD